MYPWGYVPVKKLAHTLFFRFPGNIGKNIELKR